MERKLTIPTLILLLLASHAKGQINGYNITNFQFGNIPNVDPKDRNATYNQFNIQYKYNDLRLKIRAEQFYASDSVKRDYISLSQVSAKYKIDKFKISVGSLNGTLGRGLLLRSYEVNASIYEDRVYRTQYALYKDITGIATEYKGDKLSVNLLYGKMLNNLFPPGNEQRRIDFISAIETKYKWLGQEFGNALMRINNPNNQSYYGSVFVNGHLPVFGSYYFEYVMGNEKGKGIYANWSQSIQNLGFVLEYKLYNDLFIGNGISDPPTLVKEHSYKLLNRSSHVTEINSEEGYQFEMYYTLPNFSILTFNTSWAINHNNESIINEYFTEYAFSIGETHSAKVFADWSKSDLLNEKNRWAAGIYLSSYLKTNYSTTIDLQYQNIEHGYSFLRPKNYSNLFTSVSLSYKNRLTASLLYENTSNPLIADNPKTSKKESVLHFPGVNVLYRHNQKLNISLFGGHRQGGPACTAGICYKVLDFEGIELRITSKF